MYGVMAGRGGEGAGGRTPAQHSRREQCSVPQGARRRGFAGRLVDCFRKRFEPPRQGDEEDIALYGNPAFWSARESAARRSPAALAAASRFTRQEIKLMYRGFKQECPTGMVDEESFKNIFSQFFPLGDASAYAQMVFSTMKQNEYGKVEFEEVLEVCSLSTAGIGAQARWVFSLYDRDGDGRVSREELRAVAAAVHAMLPAPTPTTTSTTTPSTDAVTDLVDSRAEHIFAQMDLDGDGCISLEEMLQYLLSRESELAALRTQIYGKSEEEPKRRPEEDRTVPNKGVNAAAAVATNVIVSERESRKRSKLRARRAPTPPRHHY